MLYHKFNAIPTILDGIRFASKKEGARYEALKHLQSAGDVLFFLRQTPFHLPGNIKYINDFTVFWKDSTISFEDVKGIKTPQYILKRKLVEHHYPITITEI